MRSAARHLLVLVAFAILTLIFTWPLPLHLSDAVLGRGAGDNMSALWNIWWARSALGGAGTLLWTPALFAPFGTSLALHSFAPLESVAAAALPFADPLTSYNLALLALVFLNQTLHERPQIGGFVARLPNRIKVAYDNDPIIGPMLDLSEGRPPGAAPVGPGPPAQCSLTCDVRYVVVNEGEASDDLEAFVTRSFPLRLLARHARALPGAAMRHHADLPQVVLPSVTPRPPTRTRRRRTAHARPDD